MHKNRRLPLEIVQEELVIRLPTEDVEALSKTIYHMGMITFAELIGYSSESGGDLPG